MKQWWCPHVGGMGPSFPSCAICQAEADIPARIFIHPRCTTKAGAGPFQAMLEEHGFDFASVCIFEDVEHPKHRRELVRRRGYDEATGKSTFERMDGTQFHRWEFTTQDVA